MANDRTAPGGMGMLLLALLEGRDMYGYEMIEALRARCSASRRVPSIPCSTPWRPRAG